MGGGDKTMNSSNISKQDIERLRKLFDQVDKQQRRQRPPFPWDVLEDLVTATVEALTQAFALVYRDTLDLLKRFVRWVRGK